MDTAGAGSAVHAVDREICDSARRDCKRRFPVGGGIVLKNTKIPLALALAVLAAAQPYMAAAAEC